MSTLRDVWQSYGKGLQWFFCLSTLAGLAVLVGGLLGDFFGLWNGLNYFPNILASLTGFLIGVPVALVLLTWVEKRREEHSNRSKIEQLSSAAWRDFAQRVRTLCAEERYEALRAAGRDIASSHSIISVELSFSIENPQESDMGELHGSTVTRARTMLNEIKRFDSTFPSLHQFQLEWAGVRRSWDVLCGNIRLQRGAHSLNFLPPEVESRIDFKFGRHETPIDQFYARHESYREAGHYYPEGGMRYYPEKFLNRPPWTIKEFQWLFGESQPSIEFVFRQSQRSGAYAQTAFEAAQFLHELLTDVEIAESDDGWPQTEPSSTD